MSINSLTRKQLNHTINYAEEIIQNLSPKALSELLGGYDNDINLLFSEILNQTSRIVNFNETSIESEKIGFLSQTIQVKDSIIRYLNENKADYLAYTSSAEYIAREAPVYENKASDSTFFSC